MTTPCNIEAWKTFRSELYWLNNSHRELVEIASLIRGRMIQVVKLT
jgi:hypothetical protein